MLLKSDLLFEFLQEEFFFDEFTQEKEFIHQVPKIKFKDQGNIEIGDDSDDENYFQTTSRKRIESVDTFSKATSQGGGLNGFVSNNANEFYSNKEKTLNSHLESLNPHATKS